MRRIDLQKAAEKYAQNAPTSAPDWTRESIRTFLYDNPRMRLNWITGIIRDGDIQEAFQMLRAMHGYGNPERYEELAQWFELEMTAQAK